MRLCRICKINKPLHSFHKRGDGHRTECKTCKAVIDSKRRRIRDGFYSVYYLPEHHYVGMTNCIKNRMQEHRRKGKITNGFEIIGRYDRAVDAHFAETFFHTIDYIGFNYKERNE